MIKHESNWDPTPYAGQSGGNNSASSDAMQDNDAEGKTLSNQQRVLAKAEAAGQAGVTVKEVRESFGIHHGTASGALSVLHKNGLLALLEDKRDKCHIYVLPGDVHGRVTMDHKSNKLTLEQVIPQTSPKEYPYEDSTTLVVGPEAFFTKGGAWHGMESFCYKGEWFFPATPEDTLRALAAMMNVQGPKIARGDFQQSLLNLADSLSGDSEQAQKFYATLGALVKGGGE